MTKENPQKILDLARELRFPAEALPLLERAAEALPELPLAELAGPESAEAAWKLTAERLPAWESEEGGIALLAATLAAACKTREAYREAGISGAIFLDTMGCLPRFLLETRELTGRWAYDRGPWTWRQTGGLLFRLGSLEFEYTTYETAGERAPGLTPGDPVLFVHVPSDATLDRAALDGSYAQARQFFGADGPAFHGQGVPKALLCESWLLSPALEELLPEGSGIRRFAGDFQRFRVLEDDPSFYRWLFRHLGPAPLEELRGDTSLQRAAKARLAAGGKMGAAWGILQKGEWDG